MKLVLSNYEYHLLGDYNTTEEYDSRIQKGTPFYKDEFKDVVVASYPPASKVSRPILASTNKNFGTEIPLLDKAKVESMLKNSVDVDKLAEKYVSKFNVPSDKSAEKFYKAGYIQCSIDNSDRTFTLADMEEIYCAGVFHEGTKEGFNKAIQLINKSKEQLEFEVEVEVEVEPDFENRSRDNDGEVFSRMKKETIKLTNGFVTIISIK